MDTQLIITVALVLLAVAFLGYFFFKKFSHPEENSITDNAPHTVGNDGNPEEVTITSEFVEETNTEYSERVNPERYDER